ncbi:TetR/AcrR family transcriptional regulator [Actinomadura algeriensis]|uniref:AcrR family transcriptional regulator n=1 Tax=Actinomadura algeriensis TaxID=1679523 RepID=A0ABR9JLN5_9ACTN|nr:TetR/AcrR family transcriptional regulator [Actinomadura algeriensis]MBE1531467.1 AcrR family transcriptional regulator [Actinomadura algeriensis]
MTDAHGGDPPGGAPAGAPRTRPGTAPTGRAHPVPGAAAHRTGGGPAARRERREQTREALLAAAERLWAERGIHGASLDDVAAAAGLTKGAVYSNFTGKTDLLLALLERFTGDRLGAGFRDGLHSADAGAEPDAGGRAARVRPAPDPPDAARGIALLLVEFWLYGMRDYAAGWRIADWYAERRARLARDLPGAGGIDPDERAALAVALDVGLAFQHLLDPERVPAALYETARELVERAVPS